MSPIRAVLLDISGVLHVDDAAIPGSVEAVQRLRKQGFKVALVTNTTRMTRDALAGFLNGLGFDVPHDDLFTAPRASLEYVRQHGLRPHLLIHPGLAAEFEGLDTSEPNAVLMGDAEDDFTYQALNRAFRLLANGARFIVMGKNRYFRAADGLSLDMGPFVVALEYAAHVESLCVGKPAPEFFHAPLAHLGVSPEEAVMVGDDLVTDVGGAQNAGLRAILVRTGKYQPNDEHHPDIHPDLVADDLLAALDWIAAHRHP